MEHGLPAWKCSKQLEGICYVAKQLGKAFLCVTLALCGAGLASCSSNQTAETPVVETAPPPVTSGPLKASQIMQALSERSFRYRRGGGRSGTVTFHGDGTFDYNEDGKGAGTGIWQASDGKLCEAFDPVSFMPKGTRSECKPFGAEGATYVAGDARFSPA